MVCPAGFLSPISTLLCLKKCHYRAASLGPVCTPSLFLVLFWPEIFLTCPVVRVGSLFLMGNWFGHHSPLPSPVPQPAVGGRGSQLGLGSMGFVWSTCFSSCPRRFYRMCWVMGISAATLAPTLFSYHVLYISSSRDVFFFLFPHLSQFSVHWLVSFKSLAWKLMGFLKNLSRITL